MVVPSQRRVSAAGAAARQTTAKVVLGMRDPDTDRYSIEIKNLTAGETVILTAVDMTEHEKSVVVRQLLRLSGAPAALWMEEDDEPKKPF
jgi:hypothetical protein